MSSTTVASETPLFVKGPDGALFGVMTVPARPNGVGVTLIPAGGYTFTPQRNGWGTNLARMLAADGYHVLRFDWHGIGDSGGSVEGFAHDRPFVDDLSVMLETMEQHGVGRHVLIGHCFGSRTLLAHAPHVDRIEAAVLLSAPVRDHGRGEGGATRLAHELSIVGYLRRGLRTLSFSALREREGRRRYARLLRHLAAVKRRRTVDRMRGEDGDGEPAPWLSDLFYRQLSALLDRQIPCLMVYGTEDTEHAEFQQALAGRLGRLTSDRVEVSAHLGRVHGFSEVSIQRDVLAEIARWLGGLGIGSEEESR